MNDNGRTTDDHVTDDDAKSDTGEQQELLVPDGPAEDGDEKLAGFAAKMRRRAGCLFSCLTEPIVIVILVVVGLITGRYVWKKKKGAQGQAPAAPDKKDDTDDTA